MSDERAYCPVFTPLVNLISPLTGRLSLRSPAGGERASLEGEVRHALRDSFGDMPLSRRSSKEYRELRVSRRRITEALLLTGITGETRSAANDLILAICEESVWAEDASDAFQDQAHPVIDLFAAETGCLLAWVLHCGTPDIRIKARIRNELRRRLFTPLSAFTDYPCLLGTDILETGTLCSLILTVILAEDIAPRYNSLMRKLVPALEQGISRPLPASVREAVSVLVPAAALVLAARILTGDSSFGDALPLRAFTDRLMVSHLGRGLFAETNDPMCTDRISGADLCLLASLTGEKIPGMLGALLCSERLSRASCLTARMLEDPRAGFTPGIIPRLKQASLPDGSMCTAACSDLRVLMNSSGGLWFLWREQPLMMLAPGIPDGNDGCDPVFGTERCSMTARLKTPSGPERSLDRGVLCDRTEGILRILDSCIITEDGILKRRFLCAQEPVTNTDGIRVGPILLRLGTEGKTRIAATPDREGPIPLWNVEYSLPVRIGAEMLEFIITEA